MFLYSKIYLFFMLFSVFSFYRDYLFGKFFVINFSWYYKFISKKLYFDIIYNFIFKFFYQISYLFFLFDTMYCHYIINNITFFLKKIGYIIFKICFKGIFDLYYFICIYFILLFIF